MRVCGVDIRASEARLVLLEKTGNTIEFINSDTRKISLADDKISSSLKTFLTSVSTFSHENKIDIFAVKARLGKGPMASGGISFKIEALFQLTEGSVCNFINDKTLTAFYRKNPIEIPDELRKFQHDAFLCANFAIARADAKS